MITMIPLDLILSLSHSEFSRCYGSFVNRMRVLVFLFRNTKPHSGALGAATQVALRAAMAVT